MTKFTVIRAAYNFSPNLNPNVLIVGTVDGVRAYASISYKTLHYANEAGGVEAVQNIIAISLVNSCITDGGHPFSAKTGGRYIEIPQYPPAKSIPAPIPGNGIVLDIAEVSDWSQEIIIDNTQARENLAWVQSLKPRKR